MDFKSILGAIGSALGVVKTATSIPGINLLPYVSTIGSAVGVIEFALEKGESIAGFVKDFANTFADGVPSQDQLDALDAKIATARAKLHMPLPAPEEGEPE